ncbi:hypothetical protein GPECTOR_43g970 [Gonium pectorale]|uniref:Uncharacterized protein n=1 Tax=Gonium pectorale TaxID=33097 RepID=A0A150G9U0_GONPE|nr:hypothetical protein GPECTOR_43g970 [Gonium pectorale]|eukprot:KXZ46533.1 hypothetical protein GPECTOR_43g970 [Gonium pectorale]
MNATEKLKLLHELEIIGAETSNVCEEDLHLLWTGGYRTAKHLRSATREGLLKAGLSLALVDYLLRLQVAELQKAVEELRAIAKDLRSILYQAASTISKSRLLDVRHALKAVIVPFLDDPTLDDLLGTQTEATVWDCDTVEDSLREWAMKEIEEGMARQSQGAHRQGRQRVQWYSGRDNTIEIRFPGLRFAVSGKNDVVLGVKSFGTEELGAVLGVVLKKKLTRQGLRQAEAQFYLWQCSSQYPFCQVITDLQTGGVAYYSDGFDQEGYLRVVFRVFVDMEKLHLFMAQLVNALPADIEAPLRPRAGPELPAAFPRELPEPRRVKPERDPPAAPELAGGLPN